MAFAAGLAIFPQLGTMTSVVDVTAVALYVKVLGTVLGAAAVGAAMGNRARGMMVVLSLNLVSVKLFGEMEFWFALIKVSALVLFLIIGGLFSWSSVATRTSAPRVSMSWRTTAGCS